MSYLQIGRLQLGPAFQWYPQVGDPISNVGGAVVPGTRNPPSYQLAIGTMAPDGGTDTPAARLVLRNRLLSMLNNTPLKMQAYLYLLYSDDPAQSGWFVPDQGQLEDFATAAGLATGLWQLSSNWSLAGRRRTNREARSVWMKDLRTGLYWRDQLRWVYSADFANLPALMCSVFPNGAGSVQNAVSGQTLAVVSLPAGRDGGACSVFGAAYPNGLVDLTPASYERSEAQLNLSDVIVYDRAGNLGPFGPAGQSYDATVLATSGLISYWKLGDSTGTAADSADSNPGTYTGGYTQGQGGIPGSADTAVLFNGTSGAITAPTATNLNLTTAFTLEAWINPTSGSQTVRLVGKGTSNNFFQYTLGLAAGVLNLRTDSGIGTYSGVTAVTPGVWSHVVITYDGAHVRFYLNGNLDSTSAATGSLSTSNQNLQIGGDPGSSQEWFSGIMGQVAVYNVGLAGTTVSSHYSAGSTNTQSYDTGAGLISPTSAYGWQEVYGPDYPWSWTNGTTPADTPTIENGLIRIRYDTGSGGAGSGAGQPGFRIDVWTGTTYSEQGKMIVERVGDVTGYCNTFVSASLVEWTPDRAVIMCVLANSSDTYSRERVFVTLQRGELSAQFECYPALKAAGTNADAILQWTPALNSGSGDLNNSILKIDSQGAWTGGTPNNGTWSAGAATTGKYAATAGTGAGTGNSGQFSSSATTLGNANFTTSENWAGILRSPTAYNTIGPYQHTLTTLQAANSLIKYAGSSTSAYGTAQDTYQLSSQNAAGYIQTQIAFTATNTQQILEAESMTLGSGWTSITDTSASGGNTAKTTQTADTGTISQATWCTALQGVYRILVRAKATANASLYAKTTTTTGTTVAVTGAATPTYQWYDLGEIVADGSTLALHGWLGSAGTLEIDRMEAVLVTDRARTGAIFSGSRDQGQAALEDSRCLGTLVAR